MLALKLVVFAIALLVASPASASVDFRGGPPAAPTGLRTDPPASGPDQVLHIHGVADQGTLVSIYDNPACAGTPLAQGPEAAFFGGGGIQVTVAPGSTTTFYARATIESTGAASACSTDSATYRHLLPPAAPSNLAVTPVSPGTSRAPRISGDTDPNTDVTIWGDSACTELLGVGTEADFEGEGIEVIVDHESTTTFYATAFGNDTAQSSGCSADSVTYTHFEPEPEAPEPPTDLTVTPTSPGTSLTPLISGQAPAGTYVYLWADADCTDFMAEATAEEFASPGIQVDVAAGSTITVWASSYDELESACSTDSVTYVHDDGPPPIPDLGGLSVTGKDKLKAGKTAVLDLSITNSGNATAEDVGATLTSSNAKVSVPPSASFGDIGPAETVTVPITVVAERSAKRQATISATVGTLDADHKLTIKKKKKRR